MNKKVFDTLKSMSDVERRELLHELKEAGVSVSARAPKAEKVYVAMRLQTKDTSPNAKRPRKAGEKFELTEKALINTVATWVRKTKGESDDAYQTRKQTVVDEIMSGKTHSFTMFDLVGIDA